MAAFREWFTLCSLPGTPPQVPLGLEPPDEDRVLVTDRGRTVTLYKVKARPLELGERADARGPGAPRRDKNGGRTRAAEKGERGAKIRFRRRRRQQQQQQT